MNFNKLRYIITVAEEQSITKAAKKLYISQPSLSQCIRSIEEQIGTELFVRGKTNTTLTSAGEIYLEWAKLTLESARQLDNKLAEIRSGSSRQLDIGISWQRGAALLPEAIDRFYHEVPGCNIRIHECINLEMQEALARDELDVAISLPNPDAAHYVSETLFQERLLLAASDELLIPCTEGNPFPYVDKDVVIGKPIIILQENQYLGQVLRRLLVELNYSPTKSTECYNLETAHRLVSKNVGVSLLPEVSVFARRLPNVNYYFFKDRDLSRTVSAVYRRTHTQISDIKQFIACLRDFLENCDYPFDMNQ